MEYARQNDIPISATPKEPWSTDANLVHIRYNTRNGYLIEEIHIHINFIFYYIYSYESGVLENPATPAPKGLYKMTVDPINSCLDAEEIEISFAKGYPINVKSLKDNKIYDTPLAIIEYLNKIGGAHGIGRIDIVENRYIGLKVHL